MNCKEKNSFRVFHHFLMIVLITLSFQGFSQTIETDNEGNKVVVLDIDGPSSNLMVNVSVSEQIFKNGDLGKLIIAPSGGVPTYDNPLNDETNYTYYLYEVTNFGDQLKNPGGTQITSAAETQGLPAGTYKIVLRDSKYDSSSNRTCNEVTSAQIELTEPIELNINTTVSQIKCINEQGSIGVNASGGYSSQYRYKWFSKNFAGNWIEEQSLMGTSINVNAGSYYVQVEVLYNNGSSSRVVETKNSNEIIIDPEPSQIQITSNHTNVSCRDGRDGSISLTVSGGSPGYSYSWSNGATSKNISSLNVGTYTVVIRDSNDCEAQKEIEISEPPALSVSKSSDGNPTFAGAQDGFINISVTGGNGEYSYEWFNDTSTTPFKTTQNVSDLSFGTYKVVVTDSKGCKKELNNLELTDPQPVVINFTENNVKCFGDSTGSIVATVSGGVSSSYIYEWFKVESTDIPIGTNSNTITNLERGTYKVKVSVIYNDIPAETQVAVAQITQPAQEISISEAITNVSCKGGNSGSISLTVSGGTPDTFGYTYQWSNGETTKDLGGLTAGSYTVRVTDSNNCYKEKTITITEPSSALSISLDNYNDPLSFGGSDGYINILASGGTPFQSTSLYTFKWYKDGVSTPIATTQNIAGIGKGTYEVKVTDANGCVDTLIHILDEPEELIATVSIPTNGQLFCHNDADGKMEVAVTGGLVPYKYHWYQIDSGGNKVFISGATGTSLSNLAAGTYGVEVIDRDGNGVKTTGELEMQNPALVEIMSSNIINVACFGDSTGEIEITLTGGSGNYIYEWTKVGDSNILGTSNKLSNIPIGEYKVKVTDNLNCPNPAIERTFTITQENELLITKDSQVNLTGFETSNGEINIENVTGGRTPYKYELRVKNTTTVIGNTSHVTGLAAGTYTMTIIDANNCSIEKDFVLTQPDKLEVALNITQSISCFGETGTIGSTTTGGYLAVGSTYTYAWYNISNNSTVIGTELNLTSTAGTYRLVVTDDNGNTSQAEITLLQNDALALTYSKVDVSCYTGNNASIDINVTGGTNSYTYIWSNGKTTQDISALTKGIYTVKVTDSNGCQLEETVTISEPDELLIANDSFTNLTGFETSNGEINVTEVIGGTTPYSYSLTLLNNTNVFSTSNHTTGLEAGVYEITITDAKGCEFKKQYTLTQPDKLEVSLSVNSIIACNGETGIIGATVTGGYLTLGVDYSYNWYNKNDLTTVIGTESSLTTVAGTYRLVVTDENGNTTFQDLELQENEEVFITYTKNDVTCYNGNDGDIDITVTGGTGVYTFLWNHGTTTEDLTSLSSGVYSVVVTDENGCFKRETIEIIQPSEYKITIDTFQRPSGAGLSDGQLSVSVQGGTPPYIYEWRDESNTILSTTNSVVDIPAGNYSLKVTDSRGCQLFENYNLGEPDPLIVSIEQTQEIKCNGDAAGTLRASAIGGVGGNSFTWYDSNNIVIGTSDVIYNLSAGSYTVKVTDANGIEDISDVFEIDQPSILNEITSYTNLTCFESNDGTISLNVFGGTPNYFYRLKESNGAYGNWVVFSNSIVIENLRANSYDVQIKDSNDCFLREGNAIKTLTFDLSQPDPLNIMGTVTEVTGYGLSNGVIDISVLGGTLPYSYEWTNSLGNTIANTQNIENLVADTYSVKVTDSNGCNLTKEFVVNQPDLLEVSIQQQNIVLCNTNETASIISNVAGGVLPYQYQWFKEGETTVLTNESSLTNIGDGNYYVIITDANNNIAESVKLEITEPDTLTATLEASSSGCGLDNDWNITSTVQGGTQPYTYSWSSGQNTSEISNASLGSYFVLVTDANGCQTTARITLENSSPLTINETISEIICYNECSGKIDLTIEGGLAPYEVLWNNGETTSSISNLCSGDYWVVVTDQNGCQVRKEFLLSNPEEFIFEVVPDEVTLCLGESIEYDVSHDEIVEYSWGANNGFESNESVVTLSEEGIYNLTVKTVNGCELSKNITIHASDTVIDAQFILTSQAFVGEDIAIINVSNPISENVTWSVPINVSIVQETREGIVLRFPASGDYKISLVSEEGSCKKIATKTVSVFKSRDLPDVGDIDKPLVKEFDVFSNPNDGNFKVNIELEKEAEVSLRLFGLSANTVITDKMLSGQKEYEVDYDINVSPGIYILLLEASKTRRIRKVIVQ